MGLMDAPEYTSSPSVFSKLRRLWLGRALWQQLLIVLGFALLAQLIGYGCGRTIDCKPGQHDGQCGLGTFMGVLVGFFGACGVLLFGVAGTVLNKVATRQKLEGRKIIEVGKILGVGLGLILLYVGVPDLIRCQAYLAAGNSTTVIFSTIEVVGGCWLVFRAFLKRQETAEK
jgi:hypothetical protein